MDEAMEILDECTDQAIQSEAKAESMSNAGSILLSKGLAIRMRKGSATVELQLTPAQALDFALNLVATARDFLQEHESLAKKAGEAAWAN